MNRITTAAEHCIVAATIKDGWAVQSAGERKQALAQRVETCGNRIVVRFSCVDDVIVTNAALSNR